MIGYTIYYLEHLFHLTARHCPYCRVLCPYLEHVGTHGMQHSPITKEIWHMA